MRVPALLALALIVPSTLVAQGDSVTASWFQFRNQAPLELRTPPALRRGWTGGSGLNPSLAVLTWDSAVTARVDSIGAARATAWRLRQVYGRSAEARDSAPQDRNPLGLARQYADLAIDGNARLELRTERLKNHRCTAATYQNPGSGCQAKFKTPRFDSYMALRSTGVIGQRLHVNVDYDSERDFAARNNLQLYYEGLEDEPVRRVEFGTVTFRPPPSRFLTSSIPANNFGINTQFEVGPVQLQALYATQKGSVVSERTYSVGNTTVQPQDRQSRDLDYEPGRFFWVLDPRTLPAYPAIDILQIPLASLPPAAQIAQGDVRVYRYRPPSRTGVNPNLGGINAIATATDTTQRITAQWELLERDLNYYVDPSGLWIALAARLDPGDYLAVSYRSAAGQVGTFPSQDAGPIPPGQAPQDSLLLIAQPKASPGQGLVQGTFAHEMRQVYRVAGADLDLNSLRVGITLNNSASPLAQTGAQPTYLAQLGLALPSDAALFNTSERLFPRSRDPGAALTIREFYIVFPSSQPFADTTRLTQPERNDSLYRTPEYLLLSEGPPAKFILRLQYNASTTGDRSGLDLGALQIRETSEALYMNGRRLERGLDYSINYDLGQVTFLDPQALFGNGGGTIAANFEERGVFAVAPTKIFGLATRYSFGEVGGINLLGLYQTEQSAFNRPQLGFEAQSALVAGGSTDLRFRPQAVTRFVNSLTSSPATAPSRLDVNGEFALTRPDPNRSGEAYLEEFEGDPGISLSLRETIWENGSRPLFADGVQGVVGAAFDTADAAQLTWQNLVLDPATNSAVEIRTRDIDPRIQVASQQDQLETVLFMTLQPDTAGGQVRQNSTLRWTMPTRPFRPRWRSIVTPLNATGVDLSKNEYLELWVFHEGKNSVDSAGVQLVVDLGDVSEDAIAMAPESLSTTLVPGDSIYSGRQFIGLKRLDTERQPTGIFNAEADDIGILGDRPDTLWVDDEPQRRPALCRLQLGTTVAIYPWGDLGARCSNGNGALSTEDLNGDNQLDATGAGENALRWILDLRSSSYMVRVGTRQSDGSEWRLYRLPLRTPEYTLGTPNIRLTKHLRITAVADQDNGGPDVRAFFAFARMRFLGAPWNRRTETPALGIAGATGAPVGDVVASIVSTENTELGYISPPGVVAGTGKKGGSQSDFGSQVNERSLRVVARQLLVGYRAEAYFRFPSGPQDLLRYRQLRAWARGRGPGWDNHDFQAFIRVGSDSRNFYQYSADAATNTWLPEIQVDLDRWRTLRAKIEERRLQVGTADSVARVACGGDTLSVAYVLCDGPYLAYIQDPAISPANLAQVQELAAGILRVGSSDPTDSAEVWIDDIRLAEPIAQVGTAMALDAHLVASDVGDFSMGFSRRDGLFQQIGENPTYQTSGTFLAAGALQIQRFLPVSLGILLPVSASFSRTDVTPLLLGGTDIEAGDVQNLRRPESWALNYGFSLRRSVRSRSWLMHGLVDPIGVSGNFSQGRNVTELSKATNSAYALSGSYLLQGGRKGFALDLGGLVDHLPAFLRKTTAGDALRRPFVNLAPTSVRLTSGLQRSEGQMQAYQVPVSRPQDSLLHPFVSLNHTWRNSAGVTFQPVTMLLFSGDLASTRDLREYPDSGTLGRVIKESREEFLGMDVGVERDHQMNTSLALSPRLTSWLRPRYATGSAYSLFRNLTSRQPVRADGDTAGAFLLPQTISNSRFHELGASVDVGRLVRAAFGDSGTIERATRRVRPFEITDRLTRTSTYDPAAFDPSLGFQLGLGGLDQFLRQGADSAVGATEVHNTSFSSGADLPLGLSFTLGYGRIRTSRFQLANGSFLESENFSREWPKGTVRLTRAVSRFPISQVGLGATFRAVQGTSQLPSAAGNPVVTTNRSRSIAPDAQFSLRFGMLVTFSYTMLDQVHEGNGNVTQTEQNDFTTGLNYAFNLPGRGRTRRSVRSQFTGVLSHGTSCLERTGATSCLTVSDNRRTEARTTFDTDLARILTGGLQFSYAMNEARHLDRKFSQIVIAATFQLSLYAGDYR